MRPQASSFVFALTLLTLASGVGAAPPPAGRLEIASPAPSQPVANLTRVNAPNSTQRLGQIAQLVTQRLTEISHLAPHSFAAPRAATAANNAHQDVPVTGLAAVDDRLAMTCTNRPPEIFRVSGDVTPGGVLTIYGRCFGTSGSVRIAGTFPYEMRGVTLFTESWNDSLARVRMSGNAYGGAWNTVTDSFTGAPDQTIDLTLATHRTAGGYTEVGTNVVSAPLSLRYVARRVSGQLTPATVSCASGDPSDATRPDWCAESGWGTYHCEIGTCLESWHKRKAPASGEDVYEVRLGHGYALDRVVMYADAADLTFDPSIDPSHVTFRVRWNTTRVAENEVGSYMFAVMVTGPQGVSP